MTTNKIKLNQVWEDKEGFRWKVLSEVEDGYKCSCVAKPRSKRTVGKFKVGQGVVWKSEDNKEAHSIFHKLIIDENGIELQASKLEQKDLISGEGKDEFAYDPYSLETYNPNEGEGEGEDEGDGSGKGGKQGVPETELPEDEPPENEDWLMTLEAVEKKYKVDVNAVTDKHITTMYETDTIATKKVPVFGKKINLKGKLTSRSVQNIIDSIKKQVSTSDPKRSSATVEAGQLWKSISDNHIAKIVYVANNPDKAPLAYYIKVINSNGSAPRMYMPSLDMSDNFSKYYTITESTAEVTTEELSIFPQLKFVLAQKAKKEGVVVIDEESEEMKLLNMQFNETYYAVETLTEILDKIK